MQKEFWFIILLALVALVGFFIFYSKNLPQNNFNVVENITYEPLDNYVAIETEEGIVVENKHAGLKFSVPFGWEAEKFTSPFSDENNNPEGAIIVSSPDAKVDEDTNIAQSGCGFSISIEYRESEKQYGTIATLIESIKSGTEQKDSQIISISGKDALMEKVFDYPEIGTGIKVSLPVKNTVYLFETLLLPTEKERCQKEFQDFLTRVEINTIQ